MINRLDTDKGHVQLVVSGNQAMSWRANVLLAASLAVVCMGIALGMAFYGMWMVIPFAGAEIVFVVGCLYYTMRRMAHQEVITVGDESVRVEWGYRHPERQVRLPRQWAKLEYRCTTSPFDVGQLQVGAHGKRYALGGLLGRDEKKVLYEELKAALQHG